MEGGRKEGLLKGEKLMGHRMQRLTLQRESLGLQVQTPPTSLVDPLGGSGAAVTLLSYPHGEARPPGSTWVPAWAGGLQILSAQSKFTGGVELGAIDLQGAQ